MLAGQLLTQPGLILILPFTVKRNEVSLEERYAKDPELLAFYQKKLLIPGWAGELSPDEFAYIKSQLRQSPSLKRGWGFRPSAKRLSKSHIQAVARDGLPRQTRSKF
jgi:hypothetical protein